MPELQKQPQKRYFITKAERVGKCPPPEEFICETWYPQKYCRKFLTKWHLAHLIVYNEPRNRAEASWIIRVCRSCVFWYSKQGQMEE